MRSWYSTQPRRPDFLGGDAYRLADGNLWVPRPFRLTAAVRVTERGEREVASITLAAPGQDGHDLDQLLIRTAQRGARPAARPGHRHYVRHGVGPVVAVQLLANYHIGPREALRLVWGLWDGRQDGPLWFEGAVAFLAVTRPVVDSLGRLGDCIEGWDEPARRN